MRVLVLGAGFGGLELSTRLSEEFGDEVEVVLIDQADGFVFGFSKLDVMFGRTVAEAVRHPYRDLAKPGVRFVQTTIRAIDPASRSVETDAGRFEGDVMVVALGADLDPGAANRLPAPMRHRRSGWRPRRPSSGPAAYNGGLIVPGPTYLGRLETGGIRYD
jgi:NADPH-dependent 2,4-dienoyl-CoA reductase/sulfur reductase-like enzyme